jgi:hypothetical protein
MFRLRTALATFALIVGLGSTSQAQMFNQLGGGFGVGGVQGGVQLGFGGFQPGFGGFQSGFGGFPSGYGVGGFNPYYGGPGFYGGGIGVPYYNPYGYYAPYPQTYNAMGSLIDSIETSTSRRGGWRRWPQ